MSTSCEMRLPRAGCASWARSSTTAAPRAPEEVWFELPERNAETLSQTGNAWLVALLPVATRLGEPLRISLPVDTLLRRGAVEVMRIWSVWHPELRVVPIEVDIADIPRSSSDRSAALFTAGVDSFFTVLDLEEKGSGVDALVSVAGFDIPHDRPHELKRFRIVLQGVADELGKELLSVTTNLRATRFRETRWGYHSHGAALASVALAISGTYPKVFCSSDDGYSGFVPWVCTLSSIGIGRPARRSSSLRARAASS